MGNEIKVHGYLIGRSVYCFILNEDNDIWNGTAFVDVESNDWADYAIPLIEEDDSGIYGADFPTDITDVRSYAIIAYDKQGVNPSSSDIAIRTGTINWQGFSEEIVLEELDGNYLTVNELKNWKINGIVVLTGTTYTDIELSRFILLAEERIEKYTGNFFYPKEIETYYDYGERIFFDYPIISISHINEVDIDDTVKFTYPVDSYKKYPLYLEFCSYSYCCGRVDIRDLFISEGKCGVNRLKIKGFFGYATVPYSIKEATARLALEFAAASSSGLYSSNVSRILWPDFSIHFSQNTKGADDPLSTGYLAIDALLNPFIRDTFTIIPL